MNTPKNKHLPLLNAVRDSSYIPTTIQLEGIIDIVHRDFPRQSVNTKMLETLKKISVNAEEFPFIKNLADKAIAEAEAVGPEFNPDPVM